MSYSIDVYDCAGHFTGTNRVGFDSALQAKRLYNDLFPGKIVKITNPDQCDVDHDGLTDEEREQIS